MSIARYASDLSGDIGARAAAAKTRSESAAAIQTEALARQSSVEGVNLDEELVNMTTYQQAFNASARMVQAAKELFLEQGYDSTTIRKIADRVGVSAPALYLYFQLPFGKLHSGNPAHLLPPVVVPEEVELDVWGVVTWSFRKQVRR